MFIQSHAFLKYTGSRYPIYNCALDGPELAIAQLCMFNVYTQERYYFK